MTTLPIASTLLATVQQIVAKRKELFRALLFPMVVSCASQVSLFPLTEIGPYAVSWRIASTVVYLLVNVLAAVTCHQVILLGSASLRNQWGVNWGRRRELAFAGTSLVIWAIGFGPAFAAMYWRAQYLTGGIHTTSDDLLWRAVNVAGWLVPAYPISRLSLVLPAAAINERITFRDSWRASRGNGWRVACVLYVPPLAVTMLWTLWFHTVPDFRSEWYDAARHAVGFLLGVFEIVALSCAYRALVEEVAG